METNQNGLVRLSVPIGISETTGLTVYDSYTANSGFNYMTGLREIKDLQIVEQIAEGTATTFLCGILIFRKSDKVLLKEVSVERNVRYSREKVVELVKNAIVDLLITSCQKENVVIDPSYALLQVEEILDQCYFENSRKAIVEWARNTGFLKM